MKKILFVTLRHEYTEALIKNTMAAAAKAGADICIDVVSRSEMDEHSRQGGYDLILFSPLLRFLQSSIEIPTKTVGSKIYGALDGEALLRLIQ